MRKLASIQRVTNIQDIEGKDKLKTCNVLGWQVLINTDLGIKENDLVVYVEIDSVLPKREEFAFLERYKYRIKTLKMAGKVSEGIVFTLDILPKDLKVVEDLDVTEILGIKKYESESEQAYNVAETKGNNKRKASFIRKYIQRYKWGRKYFPVSNKVRNAFPNWISKTDETRIQNVPFALEDGNQYEGREKIDGSSATYGIRRIKKGLFKKEEFEFVICSRNVNLSANKQAVDFWGNSIEDSPYISAAKKYDIETKLRNIMSKTNFDSVVIQGEIITPKIQGNKYKLENGEIRFYMFNLVVDGIQYHIEYNANQFRVIQEELTDIEHVPLKMSFNANGEVDVPKLMDIATFQSAINEDTLAEGMVFRSYDSSSVVKRSFKAVSPEFLIKNKE